MKEEMEGAVTERFDKIHGLEETRDFPRCLSSPRLMPAISLPVKKRKITTTQST